MPRVQRAIDGELGLLANLNLFGISLVLGEILHLNVPEVA